MTVTASEQTGASEGRPAAASSGHPLSELIDLEAYPIADLDSVEGRALVAACREQLAQDGCVILDKFVRPEMLPRLEAETERLAPDAHYNQTQTNPFNSDGDDTLPASHPKNRFADRTNGFVAGDRIDRETIIRTLYHDPDFKQFIAAVVGMEDIHEYADPLAGLVVNVLKEGCQHPWHYDTNDFIVTMMTKEPEKGGLFEYAPGLRSPNNENFEAVEKILDGDRSALSSRPLRPGDLQIFFGRFSLHRVTPVEGPKERHTVIFGYAREPGFIGRPERAMKIFGRMAPVHEQMLKDGVTRTDALAD